MSEGLSVKELIELINSQKKDFIIEVLPEEEEEDGRDRERESL